MLARLFPEVTMADAFTDRLFFERHPARRYRQRPAPDGRIWIIRRHGNNPPAFLRAITAAPARFADNDKSLSKAWSDAAYR